jgi:hypothetical protein
MHILLSFSEVLFANLKSTLSFLSSSLHFNRSPLLPPNSPSSSLLPLPLPFPSSYCRSPEFGEPKPYPPSPKKKKAVKPKKKKSKKGASDEEEEAVAEEVADDDVPAVRKGRRSVFGGEDVRSQDTHLVPISSSLLA